MESLRRHDKWADGDLYEPYVGRWSRLVAQAFLDWLAVPPDKEWLDVGCGTGALSATILERAKPYLGNFISTPSDWTPLKHFQNVFEEFAPADIDESDPWQFKNFLVGDRN